MATFAGSPRSVADARRMAIGGDPTLIASMLVLIGIGLMTLYSKSSTFDDGGIFRKQVFNIILGVVPLLLFANVNPKFWQRITPALYVSNVLLLLAVRFFGDERKGAERWIDIGTLQFQPSELAKLLTVLTLAAFFARREQTTDRPATLLGSFAVVAPPLVLILLQPHLGAALVLLVAWYAMSLVAQVPARSLVIIGVAALAVAGSVLFVPAVSDKLLSDYQRERIFGLKVESKDTQGRSYQTDRAEIAFGVGGLSGRGFLKGEQKEGRFIPEQHNDFILTVLGEEGGLVGCTLLLVVYGIFFFRIWVAMVLAEDLYLRLAATGVFAILFFHTFVNMAMVLQLLPVVGLWLPFMSAGGTAMWLCMACVGLILGIRKRERPVLF